MLTCTTSPALTRSKRTAPHPIRRSQGLLSRGAARTGAAARECFAESMQRGTPELTTQNAMRAAEAGVRRGAEAESRPLLRLRVPIGPASSASIAY